MFPLVTSQNILQFIQSHNIKDKRQLNIRLLSEIESKFKQISTKLSYLPKFCYDLKLYVHSVHGIYRLYYKMLLTYGNKTLTTKCDHHYLVHGPRPVMMNVDILKSLLICVDIQTDLLKSLVRYSSDGKMLNMTGLLCDRVVCFLDKMIYFKEKTSCLFKGGVPVKFSFLN